MKSLFIFCVIAGLAAAACAQERLHKRLIALPSHRNENATDFDRLRSGRPIVGLLELGQMRLIRFALPAIDGEFPNAIISLTTTNTLGDADVFCSPWIYLRRANLLPGRGFHEWSSIDSQDHDLIFLSSKSAGYQDAIVELETTAPDGTNRTVVGAAFACSVMGESRFTSEFELELDVTLNDHVLVKEEQDALKSIFKKCCTGSSCRRWLLPTGNSTERVKVEKGIKVELDFCHRSGSICTTEGRLRRLDMRGYNLTCPMPLEELTKMESLEKLQLDVNRLEGDAGEILAGLSVMENLQHVSLVSNDISGTLSSPKEACNLFEGEGGLQFLDLRWNGINGRIPPCILSSPTLRELLLGDNELFGKLPDVIPEGSALEGLNLVGNKMSGAIPETLSNARALRFVHLRGNRFKGKIPNSLATLPRLELLDLSNNKLTAFPDAWTDSEWVPPKSLRRVSVASNDIEGEFPVALGKAEGLATLDISANSIQGELIIEEGSFEAMRQLNASFNNLEGGIPDAVRGMEVFSPELGPGEFPGFDIRSNEMTGEIPEVFYANVTAGIIFRGVHLEDNDFTCRAPGELLYIIELDCVPDPNGYPEALTLASLTGDDPVTNEETVSTSRTSEAESSSSSSKASAGVVAAAVISALAGVVLFAAVVVFIVIRRRKKKRLAQVHFPEDGDVEIGGRTAPESKVNNAPQDSERILPGDSLRS